MRNGAIGLQMDDSLITRDKLVQYVELSRKKKEVEMQLDALKKDFNKYFDHSVGKYSKGEITISDYKLQRQVRKMEKFDREITVNRLEELNLKDLIQKKPDEEKIKSALNLGLLKENDLEGCVITSSSQAIYVKQIDS
ncbi:hypothetical protein [Peribacillus asahii]|uniref:Uncharacterized protein n=1 Tax=Peribacillus asahii TaxID=228899 RepID=A0A3Q9RRF6_9BACI|nr:hypothetical protein [Peribacillus asahii]AZV44925.1 hypothetical protein BAOM_4345 [Peribacillus asahii]USK69654.1 hypothetical protein LIS76_19350 [Peribacillus asahii]USK84553.1 hypothetical protein LIT35_19505 [Peribacillus asahii]